MKPVKNKVAATEYSFIDWRYTKTLPVSDEVCTTSLPYVKWGKKNDYPLFLNTLYQNSPSQTGIINGKVYYMTAGGYTITPVVDSTAIAAQITAFEKNGISDYSLQDLLTADVKDNELYNGWCLRGVWNPLTGKPSFLEPVDFDCIRTNEEGDRFFYSDDWTKDMQGEKTGFREIPEVDVNNKIGEFLIYITGAKKKTDKGYVKVYPAPPYSGCIDSLATEIEMQAFHFNETQNGFKLGTVMFLPSAKAKSKVERDTISNNIKNGGTDRATAGGMVVLFGEGGTDKPTVLQLNGNDLDKRYLQTETSVANTILRAHSIGTPSLFGMVVAGQLGNTQEIQNGFEVLKKTYIKSRQKSFNDTFTWILKNLYGIDAEFTMNSPPPILGGDNENEVSKALASLSPLVATKVLEKMTDNEIRGLGNLPPLEGGDVIGAPSAPTFQLKAGAKDPILKALLKAGRKRSGFIIKESLAVPCDCGVEWFDDSEATIMEALRGERLFFATILNEIQKNVLSLINEGQDVSSVAKALGKSIQEVMDAYNQLSNKGLIKKNGELSETGTRYLDVTEVPADRFEIRYSYRLRPDAPRLISESRPFCKELMRQDKLYTRQEIDSISAAVDRNVWQYRGGWYHNPTSDRNTPYCRHTWYQEVVLKK